MPQARYLSNREPRARASAASANWLRRFVGADASPFDVFRVEALLLFFALIFLLGVAWGLGHLLSGAWVPALIYFIVAAFVVASAIVLWRSRRLPLVARLALVIGHVSISAATYLAQRRKLC